MNIKKLKELEESFFEYYPNGFEDDKLLPIIKRFKSSKFHEETKELLKFESVNEYVETLGDNKVSELLNRMKTIVTLDCKKIPYLHIRIRKSSVQTADDFKEVIIKHI